MSSEPDAGDAKSHKPPLAFWATVAGITLLLYVLSFGPAVWLLDRGVLPNASNSIIERVYYPMICGLREGPRPIRRALEWYANLGAKPRDPRIFDNDGMRQSR